MSADKDSWMIIWESQAGLQNILNFFKMDISALYYDFYSIAHPFGFGPQTFHKD